MAPPPSTTISPFAILIVRVLTLIFLVISVIIMITNKATTTTSALETQFLVQIKFNDFYAYRYMVASGVIGVGYTLLQTAFTIFYVSTGNKLGGEVFCLVDFYGDKLLSYLLATGSAACFGLTVDLKRFTDSDGQRFLNKANAAGSLIFFGFIFSVISSIFSSLALPKRP